MTTYYEFDEAAVSAALQAAAAHHDGPTAMSAATAGNFADDGHLALAGGCISVKVEKGQVCLVLPLGIGKYCLPIPPIFPDGTVAEACIHICTTWGIPSGVKLTVSVAGKIIVSKSFGKC